MTSLLPSFPPPSPRQMLEVPGSLMGDLAYESLYHMRPDYWGVPYFWEQLLRDPELLVDDRASVLVIPYMVDPGARSKHWFRRWKRRDRTLPYYRRDLTQSLQQATLMQAPVYEGWFRPIANSPAGGMYLQNKGSSEPIGAQVDIALPLHDMALMPDIRTFRKQGPDANALNLAQLPQLQEERRAYYNASRKSQLELFFIGRAKVYYSDNGTEPPPQCLDERLFTASASECKCLVQYSECIRQFIYFNYRSAPKMYLRDFKNDNLSKAAKYKHRQRTGSNASASDSDDSMMSLQHSSAFCLVAGGCNFDMVSARGGMEQKNKGSERACVCVCVCV